MEICYFDIVVRIERFFDWFRVKCVVVICIKYVKRLKNWVNKLKEEICEVSVNDLEVVGVFIICLF